MNINIAILEDQLSDYNILTQAIKVWGEKTGNIVHLYHFPSGEILLDSDTIHNCHILFSDIQLNENNELHTLSGIETCIKLREKNYSGEIIFLTAFREYVFEGYNVLAFNYLLKPIQTQQLENCMDKYVSMHSLDFYYLHKEQQIIQIPYNDIISISKDSHDAVLQTTQGIYIERVSLTEIENRLPAQFVRCHKSCIINMLHVYSLVGNEIHLSNHTVQPIGRKFLSEIRNQLIKLSTN